ncbi:MAG: SDR family oxidoreductase [Proteobacteria bacterium]|nr:SDR family oxidoreductase [Pseudomonadota bacterium]
MASSSGSAALIVGASRGLGLGLAEAYLQRGWRVVGTVRGAAPTKLHDLAASSGGRLAIETVEINEPAEVAALKQRLSGRSFDVLFVNAGVTNRRDETVGEVSTDEFNRVMVTNALSPMRVIETLEDTVAPGGVIGAMSSGLGSVADNESGGMEVYRASKAALNTLMRSYAARAGGKRAVALISPGWVRTDMGGDAAPLSVAESASGIVDVLAGCAGKPGAVFIDYKGDTVRW